MHNKTNRGSHNPFDHPRNPNDNLMSNDATPANPIPANIDPRLEALLKRIESDFSYHSPKGDQAARYELIRDTAKKLACVMAENCPQSRELSSALTRLEEAVMHANASIARNE